MRKERSWAEKQMLNEKTENLVEQECFILEVAEKLLETLEQNHMTKADLARKLGKELTQISQALSGKNITLRTLQKLAGAMNRKCTIQLTKK